MIEHFWDDPDAGPVPISEAERARVKAKFNELIKSLEAKLEPGSIERHRAVIIRSNLYWDAKREKEKADPEGRP